MKSPTWQGALSAGQELTHDVGRRHVLQPPRLKSQQLPIRFGLVRGRGDLLEGGTGPGDPALRRAFRARIAPAKIPDHHPQVPARQYIITYGRDPVRREGLAADPEDGVLGRPGHPTEHAVTDHVVEPLSGQVERGQVALLEADVLKRQFGNPLAAVVDVPLGQIDAAKARPREPRRQRDDVSGRRAAEFEHAGTLDVWRVQPEQRCERGQMLRLGERDRHGRVWQQAVVGG